MDRKNFRLIFSYVGVISKENERDIKNMTKKVYHASNPRVIFTSAAVLNLKGKDLISYKQKGCVVYTYECCCSNSYTGQTSRHLEKSTFLSALKFMLKTT